MEDVSVAKDFLEELVESAISKTSCMIGDAELARDEAPAEREPMPEDTIIASDDECEIPAELAALEISAVEPAAVSYPEPEPEPEQRLEPEPKPKPEPEPEPEQRLEPEPKPKPEPEPRPEAELEGQQGRASPPSSPPVSPEKDDDGEDAKGTAADGAADTVADKSAADAAPKADPEMTLTERILWEREHRPKLQAECTLANLRTHSSKLQTRLVELKHITRGLDGIEAPEDKQLMGKLKRREHKPLSREERLWLKEAKKHSKRVKEEAVALADEKAADRVQLANNKVAKRAGRRWGTNTRIKRREHEREYQEYQHNCREKAVAWQWDNFLQQHAENLYTVYLTPPPTQQQLEQNAAQTDAGAGDHGDHVSGDFGGRMPTVPQAHELHSMDSSGLRASIGLDVDLTKLKGEPAGRPLPEVDVVMKGGALLHDAQSTSGYLDTTAVGTTTRLRREAQSGSPMAQLPQI
jgi:hypothetical protein